MDRHVLCRAGGLRAKVPEVPERGRWRWSPRLRRRAFFTSSAPNVRMLRTVRFGNATASFVIGLTETPQSCMPTTCTPPLPAPPTEDRLLHVVQARAQRWAWQFSARQISHRKRSRSKHLTLSRLESANAALLRHAMTVAPPPLIEHLWRAGGTSQRHGASASHRGLPTAI